MHYKSIQFKYIDFVCVEEDVCVLSPAILEVVLPPGVDDVDPLLAGDDGSVTLLPDLLVGVCYWGPPGAEDG